MLAAILVLLQVGTWTTTNVQGSALLLCKLPPGMMKAGEVNATMKQLSALGPCTDNSPYVCVHSDGSRGPMCPTH